jgi:hypothetical protein
MLSTYSSILDEVNESMDSVILKKKENKKKYNDAYRKRIKEIKIRSILVKQRNREYYSQNRNVIRERQKRTIIQIKKLFV